MATGTHPHGGQSKLVDPDEALEVILNSVSRTEPKMTPLRESLGRVLAQDICASDDLPPFSNSAMDGYAVIAEDTRGAGPDSPRLLRVTASEPAGEVVREAVVSGTAVRIMTGACIPNGADAVIIVEDTEPGDGGVMVRHEASAGENIRRSGEDVARGALALRAGTRIGPAEMGILAALGCSEVLAHGRPHVAILTTGNEIVDVSRQPGPGQIRDSNQYSLLGQVLRAGAEAAVPQRVSDKPREIERAITSAAEVSDVVITSGGVSVGDYDFVKETLAALGDIRFRGVAIKPGKPLVYGHVFNCPLFGLPGNPVSSMVTFDLFVRPALLRMAGVERVNLAQVRGVVSQDVKHKEGRREFVRAVTVWDGSGYTATPTGDQGSARLSSMVGANSYIVIPEGMGGLSVGKWVDILLMG